MSEVSPLSLLKRRKTLYASSLAPITSGTPITKIKLYLYISYTEKPPDDPKERKKFFIRKQTFVRYHRLYGNSLSGGVDRAKTIVVTKTDVKKKKGKNKEQKLVSAW